MKHWLALSIALLAASPAIASGPMSAAEFENYVTGRTLKFSSGGTEYGIEEYLEDRKVRWSYLDGECQDGEWYPSGEMICFVYDAIDGPQCWTFFRESSGLRALFMNDPAATELYETQTSDDDMLCLGPKIGV